MAEKSPVINREELLDAVDDFLKMPSKQLWMDYDEEADVLYISLRKPQNADDSEMDGDIVYHYDGDQLVGMTILNARNREVESKEEK